MTSTPSRRLFVLLLAVAIVAAGCRHDDRATRSDRASRVPFAYDASARLFATQKPLASTDTYVAKKVTYRSLGQTVPGYLTLPTTGASPHPCLVIQHGFGGSKEDIRTLWPDISRAGFGTLAIDARLHGERGTKQQLAAAGRTARGMRSLLQDTAVDLRRALDYLSTRRECDRNRLGFFGLSMGAFLGAMVAGADSRVRATVLLSGGGDWRVFLEQTRGLEAAGLDLGGLHDNPANLDAAVRVLDPIDPTHWVRRISPRPVLMLNGDADTIVAPDSARALHAASRHPDDVVWYHGDHLAQGTEFLKVVVVIFVWLELKLGLGLALPE